MNIIYKENKDISKDDLNKLYGDNGWTLYTNDLDKLKRSLEKSLYVKSAWKEDELIGLIRVVGDDESILYIQDILVLEKYHRKGIGSKLVKDVLEKYSHVRQKALLTGESEQQDKFYRSLGFIKPSEDHCVAFIRHDI
ncbi:GNAT family N-acetyltransferase [Acidaminobacter sp. JC074]|uniref:GNAT family N-acetyltransferase n=1 Tax=Acidaminobacter sp. JC074 TaxID=2530199 RepID=UPI001F10F8FB|nr:GNAT family N-acetyltransferase [Acidaminobacter sp. JC074]MCH4890855.1 GNAT family N-acetyltransferase [Acidaminobacter sp. JC074]